MVIVTRTSTTPAGRLEVQINTETTDPKTGATVAIERVCLGFAPGDVQTLEDAVAAKLQADAGLAAHFRFARVGEVLDGPKAEPTKKDAK